MDELLSKDFLRSIGVSLDDATYTALSQHSEETLNARVIESIIELLDENQLEELQKLQGASGNELSEWLVDNVPELSGIIEDEIAILLGDIAESSERL